MAIGAVALAFALRLWTAPVMADRAPFFPFSLAILFAGWIGGIWPGLLATALGAVGGVYFFILPIRSNGALERGDVVGVGIFVFFGIVVSVLFDRLHRYRGSFLRHAELLDEVHDAIFTWRRDGTIQYWNRAAERLYGYPSSEAVGRNAHELLRSSHDIGFSSVLRVLDTKGEWSGELTQQGRDGRSVEVSSRMVLLQEGRSDPLVIEVNRDISDRRRREELELEAQRRRTAVYELIERLQHARSASDVHRAALSAIRDALGCSRASILLFDEGGVMRFVASDGLSEGYRKAVDGHSPWTPDARDPEPIVVPDLAAAAMDESLRRVIRGEGIAALAFVPLIAEDRLIGKFMAYFDAPHEFSREEVDVALAVARELAFGIQRARGEELLRERADEVETILRAAPAAIWIAHDPECRRITSNPAAAALLGMDPEANVSATPAAPLERPFREFRRGEPIPPNELPLQLAARRGVEVSGAEIEMRFADGETRHIYGNASPLRSADGSIRGSVGAFMDVTDLKTATAALEENDRRKDEFLATLGHELRNPLAPLTTGLELLRRLGIPEDAERVRGMMERQVGAMARLVDDLLDVNRITTGRLRLQRERVPLSAVLQRAIETVRPLVEERSHRLSVSLAEDAPLDADPTRLCQVFVALLNNAAKYTEPGGTIAIEARREGPAVAVTVRDSGRGIAGSEIPYLFQMFARTSHAVASGEPGLGVGLALARSLVEMHGGRIEAQSDGPGRGCEFRVRLPLATAEGVPAPPAAEKRRAASAGLRVLVVDDNADAAASLAMLLETMGNHVRTAHDGEQAAAVASEFQPDVALLDIGMPKLDGYEAARRIRRDAKGRPLRLVALTGYGQESDRRKAEEAGFDRHLVKPLRPEVLLELLADLDRNHASSGSRER